MRISIIDNLSSNENHNTRIKQLFSECDDVILISPFLMVDFKDFFKKPFFPNIKNFHLITTLQPKSIDQIKKTYSLISLIEIPEIKNKKVNCRISVNNQLHGKIYIFKKDSNYISAIITSANFTYNGLFQNHEWGIEISNLVTIRELEDSILNSIQTQHDYLSFSKIYKLKKKIDEYLGNQSHDLDTKIDLDLTEILEQDENKESSNTSTNQKKYNSTKTYEYSITQQYLDSWDDFFNQFLEFKAKHNEVTVPRDYEDPKLYLWYRKQKIFNSNNSIPSEHKTKLEQVGFYFGDGHEIRWAKIWEEHYSLLKEYFNEYGDSDVPHTKDNTDAFYSLGNWAATQRTYNNNSLLSDYKIEKLNELDFIWSKEDFLNPINRVWLERFEELKEWKEKYETCHVKQTNDDGTPNKLGRWLNDQRRLKNTGRKGRNGETIYLEPERESMLSEIGFDFDHKKNKDIDSFEKKIQKFLSYKYQYPDLKPPTGTFEEERYILTLWRHRFSKLPEWKQKRLIELQIIN